LSEHVTKQIYIKIARLNHHLFNVFAATEFKKPKGTLDKIPPTPGIGKKGNGLKDLINDSGDNFTQEIMGFSNF
jgi:hypothetical protein